MESAPESPRAESPRAAASSPAPKAGGKLETLPKEDLIKFAKKQVVIAQRMKAKVEELTAECKKSKEELATLSDPAASQHDMSQLTELRAVQQEMSAKIETLSHEKEAAMQAKKDLSGRLESAVQENETLKKKWDTVQAESSSASIQVKSLQETIECLEMKNSSLSESLQTMLKEREEMSARIKDTRSQLDIQSAARDKALQAAKALKQKYLEATAETQSVEEAVATLEQRLVVANQERAETLNKVKQDNEASLAALKEELEAKAKSMSSEAHKVEDLQTQVTQLSHVIQEKEQELTVMNDLLLQRESEGKSVSQTVSDLQGELGRVLEEKDVITTELADIRQHSNTQHAELRTSLEAEREKTVKAQNELESLEQRLEEMEKERETESAKHAVQLKESHVDTDRLKTELAKLQSNVPEADTLKTELSDTQERVQHLIEDIKGLEAGLEAKSTEIIALKNEQGEGQQTLEKERTVLCDKEAELDRLSAEMSTKGAALERSQAELNTKTEELASKENYLLGEKAELDDRESRICNEEKKWSEKEVSLVVSLEQLHAKELAISGIESDLAEKIQQAKSQSEKLAAMETELTEAKAALDAQLEDFAHQKEKQLSSESSLSERLSEVVRRERELLNQHEAGGEGETFDEANRSDDLKLKELMDTNQRLLDERSNLLERLMEANKEGDNSKHLHGDSVSKISEQVESTAELQAAVEDLTAREAALTSELNESQSELTRLRVEQQHNESVNTVTSNTPSKDSDNTVNAETGVTDTASVTASVIAERDAALAEKEAASEEKAAALEQKAAAELATIEEQSKHEDSQQQVVNLRQEQADMQLQIEALEEKLVSLKSEREQTALAFSDCEALKERLAEELKRAASHVDAVDNAERQRLEQELSEFVQQAEHLTCTVEQLKGEAGQAKHLADKVTEEMGDRVSALIDQVAALKTRGQEMEDASETWVKEKKDMEKVLDKLKVELAERDGSVGEAAEKLAVFSERVTDLGHQVDAGLTREAALSAIISSLKAASEAETSCLSEEGAAHSDLLHVVTEERDKLAILVKSSQNENECAITALQAVSSTKDVQIASLESEATKLADRITELEKETDSRLSRISELEAADAVLKGKSERVKKLEDEVEQLTSQITALEAAVDGYKNQPPFDPHHRPDSPAVAVEQTQTSRSVATQELTSKMKEAEAKCHKFKSIALKEKKESIETKKQLARLEKELAALKASGTATSESGAAGKSSVDGTQKLLLNFQSLQKDYDRLQDDLDGQKVERKRAEHDSERAVLEVCSLREEVATLQDSIRQQTTQLDMGRTKQQNLNSQLSDHKMKIASLESDVQVKERAIEEFEKALTELKDKLKNSESCSAKTVQRLTEEKEEMARGRDQAKDNLEEALKNASKNSLVHLEIADYERTVEDLQSQLSTLGGSKQELQQEVQHLREQHSSIKAQMESADTARQQADTRSDKLKHLLVKAKKDLVDAHSQGQEQKSADAQLRGQLEGYKQQEEIYKMELTELSAQKMSLTEEIRSTQEYNEQLSRHHQTKMVALREECDREKEEKASLQLEFENYKIRVFDVLKKQKTRTSDEVALETEKSQNEKLEAALNQLKIKLQTAKQGQVTAVNEADTLREELDRLQLRHNQVLEEFSNKESDWRRRCEQLSIEASTVRSQQASTIQEMSKQHELLTETFREQLAIVQSEHKGTTDRLQNKLDKMTMKADQLQLDLQRARQANQRSGSPIVMTSSVPSMVSGGGKPSHHGVTSPEPAVVSGEGGQVVPIVDPKRTKRESGEGMERPDDRDRTFSGFHSPAYTQGRVPLQRLISSTSEISGSELSLAGGKDERQTEDPHQLRAQMVSLEKQLEHVTVLLKDSEETNERLSEQAMVLKGEIRRQERNVQRESSISNMEYLKNIIFKFLSLKPGTSEKTHLIPVLKDMLRLGEEEVALLHKISSDQDSPGGVDGSGAQSSAWGAYLHRWSGLNS